MPNPTLIAKQRRLPFQVTTQNTILILESFRLATLNLILNVHDFPHYMIRTMYLLLSEAQKIHITAIIDIRNAIASPTQTRHFG